MTVSIIDSSEPDSDWNERLLYSQLGSMQQTKEYAFSKVLSGITPLFLKFVSSDGNVVGQLLVLLTSRLNKKGSIGKLLKKLSNVDSVSGKWVYGPIIFDEDYREEIFSELKNYLTSKNYKIWGSNFPLSENYPDGISPFTKKSWGTFLIDLSLDIDTLWKNLDKHSAKKNIERSKERNVVISEMKKSDLSVYFQMYLDYGKTHPDVTLSFLEKQWDILHPIGYSGFIAYENDIPVGAIRFSSFNGYINEYSIIRSERDTVAKLYSQDLLKWSIIEWGIKNNCKYFDLSGVNPSPEDSKEKGIFRYKQKWGGTLKKYDILLS